MLRTWLRPLGGRGAANGPWVHGSPGRSARVEHRRRMAAYRRLPAGWRVAAAGLLLALVGAAAVAVGADPTRPLLLTAAVLTVAHLVVRYPAAAATGAVLVGFAVAVPAVAAAYTWAAVGPGVDPRPGQGTLLATGLLVALLAHRGGRPRPWLTTLLALVALTAAGPLLLLLAPRLGFLAAYLTAGAALALRSGAGPWLGERWEALRETAARWRPGREPETVARWRRGAQGEEATAALLAGLDGGHAVLHDLALPASRANVDHLVLGPGGLFLVDSKAYRGVLRVHPQRGVEHNGRPLARTLGAALYERNLLAAALGVPRGEVAVLVVVHGAALPAPRTRVAVYDRDGGHLGEVLLLAPDRLLAEITGRAGRLTPRRVVTLRRLARRRLPPAGGRRGPVPVGLGAAVAAARRTGPGTTTVVLDGPAAATVTADPQPLLWTAPADELPVVHPGQPVAIHTDQGVFTGLRVVSGPITEPDGTLTVGLCPEAEWWAALADARPPAATPYPVASVRPDPV